MDFKAIAVALLAGLGGWGASASAKTPHEFLEFTGMCDASAAVAVDDRHFLVASDEDSILRLYRADQPGAPLQTFDLSGFLQLDARHPETDIEAAALLGGRAYWISSHGRNARGKFRESRDRFFAITFKWEAGRLAVHPEGRPYSSLLADLESEPKLRRYHFARAALKAPKERGALNIEGLAATPDGHLLLGFRNPIPHRRALIVPLLNPTEVIAGARARLADPLEVDLGGLGVRDMLAIGTEYLIVAGPSSARPNGRLFKWAGGNDPPRRVSGVHFKDFNPEAAIVYPGTGFARVQLLSDDGTRLVGGCVCKELKDPALQRFRSAWVALGGD